MSRFKLVLLSLLAVFAFGALGASSASAACSGGTKSVFCFSNNEEIHEEAVLGTGGLSLLTSLLKGKEFKLRCNDSKFTGTLELLGAGKGLIELLGCSVTGLGPCAVVEPTFAKFNDKLSSGAMPATDTFTGSGAGALEEFIKLTLREVSCPVNGEYTLVGLQHVELPEGEMSLVEHKIVAKELGSLLKLGEAVALFSSTATVHLASSAPFLIMLGI